MAVERFVVTDRKLVKAVLYDTAAALEANDLNRVLAHVAPEDAYTRQQAAWVLGAAEIEELKISYLEVTINRLTSPQTATAKFNVLVTGRDRRGEIGTLSRVPESWSCNCAATRADGSSSATSFKEEPR